MAYVEEKKEHDYLINLLKKHFEDDEVEEVLRGLYGDEEKDDDDDDDLQEDEMEDEEELPGCDMMEDEGEEEEMELPKDKRKGLAVVIIQKRMSKPKKDMY